MQCAWEAQMNNPRDFSRPPLDGAPTMAAPVAGQRPGTWPQQAPLGDSAPYRPYGQQSPDTYYAQQPPTQLPVYKRPGVVFGAAAVAAVIAVGALLATWVSKDSVSTTPVNNTGTPTQQVLLPPAPAPPSAAPPSQSVVVQQPAPRSVPRQQAPAPRVAPSNPSNPSAVSPAPASSLPDSPVPEPIPEPQQKQDPEPQQKQDPPDKFNPGDPENPTPDDLLCHPNPPGCTGDQKAPAQQQQPAP
jgi:hypothetical protein